MEDIVMKPIGYVKNEVDDKKKCYNEDLKIVKICHW